MSAVVMFTLSNSAALVVGVVFAVGALGVAVLARQRDHLANTV